MSLESVARYARGALLLAGLSSISVVASAQPNTGDVTSRSARSATDSLEQQAAARVADAVCAKRVVLLGELPEHGHARGFGVKARVVERLVSRCGFRAVLFEAGSYDFFGLEQAIERAVAASPQRPGSAADSLELALARAIGGLWWTRELAEWRRWLVRETVGGRAALGGLDDQPIGMTAAWARAMLPGLVGAAVPAARAAECREAVARHVGWRYTATEPYDSTERARLAECTALAAARPSVARASAHRTPDEVMLDNLAGYFARERGAAGARDRDLAMAQNLAWWVERLPSDAKIVVWTATTHAARALGAPSALPLGVLPLGARAAERWKDQLAVIGFTALEGEWGRSGQPARPLAPLPPGALESRALAARAVGNARSWAYLDHAALRALGPVPSRLFGSVTTTDWSIAFDGVLVIREEAVPTFEPRR